MDRKLPDGATEKDGKIYNRQGDRIELHDGRWRTVPDRSGWWRDDEEKMDCYQYGRH